MTTEKEAYPPMSWELFDDLLNPEQNQNRRKLHVPIWCWMILLSACSGFAAYEIGMIQHQNTLSTVGSPAPVSIPSGALSFSKRKESGGKASLFSKVASFEDPTKTLGSSETSSEMSRIEGIKKQQEVNVE